MFRPYHQTLNEIKGNMDISWQQSLNPEIDMSRVLTPNLTLLPSPQHRDRIPHLSVLWIEYTGTNK